MGYFLQFLNYADLSNRIVCCSYFHNTVGHVFQECDAICVRDHICTISHLMVGDMQTCQDGEHVLFRNDPIMTSHFQNIAQRATFFQNKNLMLGSFLAALTLLCIVIGVTFIAMRRRSSVRIPRGTYHGPGSSYPRQSDYTRIISDDA